MAGYGTNQDFAEWLADSGYVLPAGAPSPDILRQRGSDYIDALYGACFFGSPTDPLSQERAWPRTGATLGGIAIPPDVIPRIIVVSSYRAAWLDANNPDALSAVIDPSRRIKRQRVENAVEREFFEGGEDGSGSTPYDTLIDGWLKGLVDQVCLGREEAPAGYQLIWAIGR